MSQVLQRIVRLEECESAELSPQSEYDGALDELSMAETRFIQAAIQLARQVLPSERDWAPALARISQGARLVVKSPDELVDELASHSDVVLEHLVRHLHRNGERGPVTWELARAGVAFRRAQQACRAACQGWYEGARRLRQCAAAIRLATARLGE
jgi:hypothetical protein